MNTSDLTRKDQVLARLLEDVGEWVDGTELATEAVGGSEGLKRLRELRAEGYPIVQRVHPDPDRDIHQYRLIANVRVNPKRIDAIEHKVEKIEQVAEFNKRLTFGAHRVCPACGNKRSVKARAECRQCNGRGYVEL